MIGAPLDCDVAAAKSAAAAAVEAHADGLIEVAHRLHAQPELMFQEYFAAALLADRLEQGGLEVSRGAFGLPTAFVARSGEDNPGPCIAVMCEYDALPGIGHGCGHNVIAAAGLGAGLGAAAVVGACGGRLVVLGTPAEEGGGGKVLMMERGALDGVDAAMMIHPAAVDLTEPEVLAITTFRVEYRGVAAHAAASPWLGRNALDAAVLGYNAVAALRQHIAPTERIHGVFTEAGEKPNIVPDRAVAEWYVRSSTTAALAVLAERVRNALQAGASAAGCEMVCQPLGPDYAELVTNAALMDLYRTNSAAVGRPVAQPDSTTRLMASTDAGNVSLAVPTIHPLVKIAPDGVSLHSADFAQWSVSAAADRAIVESAKAMAMTMIDVWMVPGSAEAVRRAFDSPAPA